MHFGIVLFSCSKMLAMSIISRILMANRLVAFILIRAHRRSTVTSYSIWDTCQVDIHSPFFIFTGKRCMEMCSVFLATVLYGYVIYVVTRNIRLLWEDCVWIFISTCEHQVSGGTKLDRRWGMELILLKSLVVHRLT